MAIKIYTKEFSELLPKVFAVKQHFLGTFGGSLQVTAGIEQKEKFMELKVSDTDVVVQNYSTDANTGFGSGTGKTLRFGERKEIKSIDVQVEYEAPLAIHEGVDDMTVNDDAEQVIEERAALHGKWIFAVVRDDNYQEVTTAEVETINSHIEGLIKFANTIKTKEQKELEEAEKNYDETLKVIYNKTTLEERLKMINVLKRWREGEAVKKGDERTYNDILFIAKKDHICSYETIPINDVEFWRKAVPTAEIPEDYNHEKKYKINDKCTFNGHIWSSLVEQEGQSPFASPTTWEDEGEF